MCLKILVGFVASLLALTPFLSYEGDVDGQVVCTAFALIASTSWGRKDHARQDCLLVAALVISLVPLAQLVADYPVCHQAFARGWFNRDVLDVPLLGCLTRLWLGFEHLLSDCGVRQSISWSSFGVCCGLATAQAFAAPLTTSVNATIAVRRLGPHTSFIEYKTGRRQFTIGGDGRRPE